MIKFKIKSLGITHKEFNSLVFGRQIEYYPKFAEFKAKAKTTHVSQKRTTHAKAVKDFIKLYDVDEYWYSYQDGEFIRDDSFEVFYTVKTPIKAGHTP